MICELTNHWWNDQSDRLVNWPMPPFNWPDNLQNVLTTQRSHIYTIKTRKATWFDGFFGCTTNYYDSWDNYWPNIHHYDCFKNKKRNFIKWITLQNLLSFPVVSSHPIVQQFCGGVLQDYCYLSWVMGSEWRSHICGNIWGITKLLDNHMHRDNWKLYAVICRVE